MYFHRYEMAVVNLLISINANMGDDLINNGKNKKQYARRASYLSIKKSVYKTLELRFTPVSFL